MKNTAQLVGSQDQSVRISNFRANINKIYTRYLKANFYVYILNLQLFIRNFGCK